jgi:hypothetical protein
MQISVSTMLDGAPGRRAELVTGVATTLERLGFGAFWSATTRPPARGSTLRPSTSSKRSVK